MSALPSNKGNCANSSLLFDLCQGSSRFNIIEKNAVFFPGLCTMRVAHIALVMVLLSFGAAAESDEPFGVTTVAAPENEYAPYWRKVRDDWAVERETLERCRVEREDCPSRAALQFLTAIDEASVRTGRARLGYINREINLAIRYMNDSTNYSVPEIWTAPLATLARGAGDCTDFVIAKYFALGELGVPENDRRLVVVSTLVGGVHAVLAVREYQHWLILDNRSMAIVDAADLTQYVPLLVFDHRGARRFVQPALAELVRAACVSSS